MGFESGGWARTIGRPAEVDPLRAISRSMARDQNRAGIFATILTQGPLSRSDVARLTGLSAATVTKAVKPLLDDGFVLEGVEVQDGPGRPSIPLEVNDRRLVAVGVKLTGSSLTGVLVDLRANVLASRTVRLRSQRPESVVRGIASITDELVQMRRPSDGEAFGIGIAVGGHVDAGGRLVRYAPFLHWTDVALAGMVEDATGLPCVVENDVNALAFAELWFGAGRSSTNFAVVTVGAGVGCGIVINGEVMHGSSGSAGELGHLPLESGTEQCTCGRRGCLETVASETAILAHIVAAGGRSYDSIADAALAARSGDRAAQGSFQRAGHALGIGLAALLNIINPALIVLSGEGLAASDLFIDAMQASLTEHAFSTAAADCELLIRPLGPEIWARGAASIVLDRLICGSAQLAGAPS